MFKVIKGFPTHEVSSEGEVRNRKTGRILKGRPARRGYLQVSLRNDSGRFNLYIHRLVAQAFIENPDNLPQVNHIDEDVTNNSVGNLEWMTQADNIEYSQAKTYTFVNPKGDVEYIFNLNKFCRNNGYQTSGFYCLLKGEYNTYRGWTRHEK